MNDLKITRFLVLVTLWAGICLVNHFASAGVINDTRSFKNQGKELTFISLPGPDYAFNSTGTDNEYKALLCFGFYTREIEGPTAFQSYNNVIKIDDSPRRQVCLPECHFCLSLHNRAFYCKYQT
jgi:hypothetical protein